MPHSPIPPLGPPPQPRLELILKYIVQRNRGGSNAGGTVYIYTSPTGGPPWTVEDSAAWEAVKNWGDAAALPPRYLCVDSVGNDIDYAGPSENSNIYNNTAA